MATGIAAWNEWKARCALGRCSEEARSELSAFARHRFATFLRRYAGGSASRRPPEAADCWHLLETRLVAGRRRSGKRYKDWLFARVGPSDADAEGTLRAGASLLLRDVVREHLRREAPPPFMVSLNAAVGPSGGRPLTLEDLLPAAPDAGQDVARREMERLAAERAAAFAASLRRAEKVAFAARERGVSLTHPAVLAAARCGRSALAESWRRASIRLMKSLADEFPNEDPDALRWLTALTVQASLEAVFRWAGAEKSCARFFRSVET
jgi:hypothetical protein